MDMLHYFNALVALAKANPEIAGALLLLAINIANGLASSSKPGLSAFGKFLRALLDRVSFTTNRDAKGTFKMPGKRSVYMNGVAPAPKALTSRKKSSGLVNVIAPLLALSLGASGCACYGEAAQTKGCVIAKQILECTKSTGFDAIMHMVPVLLAFINGGQMDFDAVLKALEQGGFANAACIIEALKNDLVLNPSPPAQAFVAKAKAWSAANLGATRVVLP